MKENNTEIIDKLFEQASIKIIKRNAWLAPLILSIRISHTDDDLVAAIDKNFNMIVGRSIFKIVKINKNKNYIGNNVILDTIEFLLEHELSHVIRNHFERMESRDPFMWNIATDIEINSTIISFKHNVKNHLESSLQAKILDIDSLYENEVMKNYCVFLSAEEIYEKLCTIKNNISIQEGLSHKSTLNSYNKKSKKGAHKNSDYKINSSSSNIKEKSKDKSKSILSKEKFIKKFKELRSNRNDRLLSDEDIVEAIKESEDISNNILKPNNFLYNEKTTFSKKTYDVKKDSSAIAMFDDYFPQKIITNIDSHVKSMSYMSSGCMEYSTSILNRREYGDFLLPGMVGGGNMINVIVDVSGSTSRLVLQNKHVFTYELKMLNELMNSIDTLYNVYFCNHRIVSKELNVNKFLDIDLVPRVAGGTNLLRCANIIDSGRGDITVIITDGLSPWKDIYENAYDIFIVIVSLSNNISLEIERLKLGDAKRIGIPVAIVNPLTKKYIINN